jgi:hypothetical protein
MLCITHRVKVMGYIRGRRATRFYITTSRARGVYIFGEMVHALVWRKAPEKRGKITLELTVAHLPRAAAAAATPKNLAPTFLWATV